MNYPRQYIGITGFALGSDTVATLEIRSLHVEDTSPWFENPLFRDFLGFDLGRWYSGLRRQWGSNADNGVREYGLLRVGVRPVTLRLPPVRFDEFATPIGLGTNVNVVFSCSGLGTQTVDIQMGVDGQTLSNCFIAQIAAPHTTTWTSFCGVSATVVTNCANTVFAQFPKMSIITHRFEMKTPRDITEKIREKPTYTRLGPESNGQVIAKP
ncbi:hypothetical protein B0H17DRAFT_1140688 [Mycena rosella]|uniref:Uncharacterized protein n=1 Tax=Mycena rosella TaxID=1033263 RepID=A0AAD7GB14_MYCRO|nr:hypothetical protein B0H17DRAFT_1140688 [Mycena rosella]